MKIQPVKAKLFQADRRTDMMKLTVTFRTFANIPKNLKSKSLILRFYCTLVFLRVHQSFHQCMWNLWITQ